MPFHYYHHERMRVCLVHTTCLTLVPCVPRTCPDVEPSRGTRTSVHTNARLRAIRSAVVPRFRVKQTSGAWRTVDLCYLLYVLKS